jgi:hypothetical protein
MPSTWLGDRVKMPKLEDERWGQGGDHRVSRSGSDGDVRYRLDQHEMRAEVKISHVSETYSYFPPLSRKKGGES